MSYFLLKFDTFSTYFKYLIGASCGRGIFITGDLVEIERRISLSEDTWVVEEYVMNPLLWDGFKFDMRIYVAVTSFLPLKVYLHEEGLARLASSPYQPNDNKEGEEKEEEFDVFRHLTNYSINKQNPSFQQPSSKNETNGGKRSLESVWTYLQEVGGDVAGVKEKIRDIVVKTLISIEPAVVSSLLMYLPNSHIRTSPPPNDQPPFTSLKKSCFQLFGFDILLDDEFKAWLLEVNLSPSLNTDSCLDLRVKSKVFNHFILIISFQPTEILFELGGGGFVQFDGDSSPRPFIGGV